MKYIYELDDVEKYFHYLHWIIVRNAWYWILANNAILSQPVNCKGQRGSNCQILNLLTCYFSVLRWIVNALPKDSC